MIQETFRALGQRPVPQEDFAHELKSDYESIMRRDGLQLSEDEKYVPYVGTEEVKQNISPRGMRFPKAGMLRPLFARKLDEMVQDPNDNLDLAMRDYYRRIQLEFDRQASKRIFGKDKMLRDLVRSSRNSPHFKLEKLLGEGGFGSVTLWSRRQQDPNNPASTVCIQSVLTRAAMVASFTQD